MLKVSCASCHPHCIACTWSPEIWDLQLHFKQENKVYTPAYSLRQLAIGHKQNTISLYSNGKQSRLQPLLGIILAGFHYLCSLDYLVTSHTRTIFTIQTNKQLLKKKKTEWNGDSDNDETTSWIYISKAAEHKNWNVQLLEGKGKSMCKYNHEVTVPTTLSGTGLTSTKYAVTEYFIIWQQPSK